MDMWMKIVWAALLGVFIWRMVPIARHWLKNGPRGSNKEWMTTAMLLGGVALFVLLLMKSVAR